MILNIPQSITKPLANFDQFPKHQVTCLSSKSCFWMNSGRLRNNAADLTVSGRPLLGGQLLAVFYWESHQVVSSGRTWKILSTICCPCNKKIEKNLNINCCIWKIHWIIMHPIFKSPIWSQMLTWSHIIWLDPTPTLSTVLGIGTPFQHAWLVHWTDATLAKLTM